MDKKQISAGRKIEKTYVDSSYKPDTMRAAAGVSPRPPPPSTDVEALTV